MLNERIVASGIYYYEEENISESRLAFCVTTGAPTYHRQDDDLCMGIFYGLERETHYVQDLGSIATTAGRVLAWPNVYQHRVAPFRLLDPTKPSHRKILAIFLVDPSIKPIPSATNIPPQQGDWNLETLMEAGSNPNPLFSRLPPKLLYSIHSHLPKPVTFRTCDEAETYRLQLMKERTGFVQSRKQQLSSTCTNTDHLHTGIFRHFTPFRVLRCIDRALD
ncbi:hypothetical protein K438DRAFT_1728247 [Mycena galopus ATCC 62051]|nr:hypothetical protein K438DRAFT_1728247 [Mycena galopus ATCC 62051]